MALAGGPALASRVPAETLPPAPKAACRVSRSRSCQRQSIQRAIPTLICSRCGSRIRNPAARPRSPIRCRHCSRRLVARSGDGAIPRLPRPAQPVQTASSAGGPQFGPQILQAFFSLQANAADGQSSAAQGGAPDPGIPAIQATPRLDPADAARRRPPPPSSRWRRRDREPSSDVEFVDQRRHRQTAANSNGSSTTSIDYSDGSSISMTTAPGSSSSSSTSSGTGYIG